MSDGPYVLLLICRQHSFKNTFNDSGTSCLRDIPGNIQLRTSGAEKIPIDERIAYPCHTPIINISLLKFKGIYQISTEHAKIIHGYM